MLLEKKTVQGSTGVIALAGGQISFTPNGDAAPSVAQPIVYQKK